MQGIHTGWVHIKWRESLTLSRFARDFWIRGYYIIDSKLPFWADVAPDVRTCPMYEERVRLYEERVYDVGTSDRKIGTGETGLDAELIQSCRLECRMHSHWNISLKVFIY